MSPWAVLVGQIINRNAPKILFKKKYDNSSPLLIMTDIQQSSLHEDEDIDAVKFLSNKFDVIDADEPLEEKKIRTNEDVLINLWKDRKKNLQKLVNFVYKKGQNLNRSKSSDSSF